MSVDPNTVNAINTMLGVMLACLMVVFWSRGERKLYALLWMLAAWCCAYSYAGFFLRVWINFELSTLLASCTTTLGMLLLLLGIQAFMDLKPSWGIAASILACHVVSMACIIHLDASTEGRMMLNSLFWGGLSAAIFLCIRRAAPETWRDCYGFPSIVFGSHALFHLLRFAVAAGNFSGAIAFDLTTLQSISFCEASLFTVALFMSLLISDLRVRNRQLQSAIDEVRALSGLLPICSGCKKIRDDAGYWTKLETFISLRSGAQFSHGLCPECAKRMYPDIFAGLAANKAASIVRSGASAPPPRA